MRRGLSPEGATLEIPTLRESAPGTPDRAVSRAAGLVPRLTDRAGGIGARFHGYRDQALGDGDMQTARDGIRELPPQATGRSHDEIASTWTLTREQ